MNERLLQYIWQYLHFSRDALTTADGQPLQILFQGNFNTNQGPDFLNARIKLNRIEWAGHIELHIKTSDWNKHRHNDDENYKNIILHVVWEHDFPAKHHLPVLELKSIVSSALLSRYDQMMQNKKFVACENTAASVKPIIWFAWKERMVAERLTQRTTKIQQALTAVKQHWEEVFWQVLARNFGIPLNASLFEEMASTVPLQILAKHKNQIHQLEALLLGQANLLNGSFNDHYPQMLQKEYRFLQKKYKLKQVHQQAVLLRMRPSGFPAVRLAQLAMLIHQSSHLFSKLLEAQKLEQIRQLLDVTANDFWHTHYTLQEASGYKRKQLGKMMIDNILINTVIPVVFAYGSVHNNEQLKQKALKWLQQLPKETSSITKKWEQLGVIHHAAFDSQALLQLKKFYCSEKRCLSCAIGNAVLK